MAEEDVIEIDVVQLKKMKVQELRKQAADLGLASKGTKAELLARVEKYLKEQGNHGNPTYRFLVVL